MNIKDAMIAAANGDDDDAVRRATTGFMEAYDRLRELGAITEERVGNLIGQCAHESGGFWRMEENLNYNEHRLMQVWPNRFKTLERAEQFAHNPEALANEVYGGRMGNNKPGDGWKYRGRGYLQLTGKDNYIEFGVDYDPNLLKNPADSWVVAAKFFSRRSLTKRVLDKEVTRSAFEWADFGDVSAVTQIINGGQNGLDDRMRRTDMALAAL